MSQDDLALGARIDRLTRAVEDLSARVDRQEEDLASRVDVVARRLTESADRVEHGLAASDSTIADRLDRTATTVRARVEELLAEVREQLAVEREATGARLDARADRLEQAAGDLASVVPELREVTTTVATTATGLSASASGLAGFVQEVVSTTEEVSPAVEEALAGLDERVRAAIARVEARLDEARAAELGAIGEQLGNAVGAVEGLREQITATIDSSVRDATSERVEAEVGAAFAGLQQAVEARMAELRVEATEQLKADVQVALGQVRATTDDALEGATDRLLETVAEVREQGEATDLAMRTTLDRIGADLGDLLADALGRQADESAAAAASLRGVVVGIVDQLATLEEQQQLALGQQRQELVEQGRTLSTGLEEATAGQRVVADQLQQLVGEVRDDSAVAREHLLQAASDLVDRDDQHRVALSETVSSATADLRVVVEDLRSSVLASTDDAASMLAARLDELAELLGERQATTASSLHVSVVDAVRERLTELEAHLATRTVTDLRELLAATQEQLGVALDEHRDAVDVTTARVGDELRSTLAQEAGEVRSRLTTVSAAMHDASQRESATTRRLLDEVSDRLEGAIEEHGQALTAGVGDVRAQAERLEALTATMETDLRDQVDRIVSSQQQDVERLLTDGQQHLAERVAAFETATVSALEGLVGAAQQRSAALLEELLDEARVAYVQLVDRLARQVVDESDAG